MNSSSKFDTSSNERCESKKRKIKINLMDKLSTKDPNRISFLFTPIFNNSNHFKLLTIVGTNGGLTFLSSKSSQEIPLKKACFLTSSASLSDEPSLRSGFLRSN